MRLVTYDKDDGTLSLTYMWLPTWLGMNTLLLRKLDEQLREDFRSGVLGKEVTDELLDLASARAQKRIVEMFPALTGLDKYLSALQHVEG